MSKIYCGASTTPPKGSRFGTIDECAEKGQVRRYGVSDYNTFLINQYLSDIYLNYAKLDAAVKNYMKTPLIIEQAIKEAQKKNKKLEIDNMAKGFATITQQIEDMKQIALYSSRIFYAEQGIYNALKHNNEIRSSIEGEINKYGFKTKINLIKFLKKTYNKGLYKLQDIVDISVPFDLYNKKDKTLRSVFHSSAVPQMKAIFKKNKEPSYVFIEDDMFMPEYIEQPLNPYDSNTVLNIYNEAKRWANTRRFGEVIPFSTYFNPSSSQLLQDKADSYKKTLLTNKRFMASD